MNEKYWFARGYFVGRTLGTITEELDSFPDYLRNAFSQGYEAGVADYCAEDEMEEDGQEV